MTDKLKEDIAQILRDNITFSGQTGDYIIHGAIDKLIEYFTNCQSGQGWESINDGWVSSDDINQLRNELYNSIHSGTINAFDLIDTITEHINKLGNLTSRSA